MKKRFLLLLTLVATMAALPAEAKKDKTTPEQKGLLAINRPTAEAHVGFLASDALKGRESGTEHGHIAGEYLIAVLKQMNATPLFGDSFAQPFDAYSYERRNAGFTVNPESVEKIKKVPHRIAPMRNILAKIEGRNPEEIVIVGAHYDHLGYDPMLHGDQIYNGADDNASGVQAVLQVARAFLATGVQPERTTIFAFWDGEEKGLLGSKYFALTYPEIGKVKGYLNYDMIGRNNNEANPKHVVYFYTEAYPMFGDWLKNDIVTYGLELDPNYRPWDNPVGGSDNGTFAKLGIPIIWYHTDAHPDYHMPGDHAERLNWDKVVDITKASFLAFWKLANEKY